MTDIENQKIRVEKLIEILKKLLPMQGCITCQDSWVKCEYHGYIVDVVKEAEELLSEIEKSD